MNSYCDNRIVPIEEDVERKAKASEEKIKWIIDKNLRVPGLVGAPSEEGEEPKYEDLASYLKTSSEDTAATLAEIRETLDMKINTLVDDLSATLSGRINKLTKDLESEVDGLKGSVTAVSEKLDTSTSQLRTDLAAKIQHVEHELEQLNAHLCENKKDNEFKMLPKTRFEQWRESYE